MLCVHLNTSSDRDSVIMYVKYKIVNVVPMTKFDVSAMTVMQLARTGPRSVPHTVHVPPRANMLRCFEQYSTATTRHTRRIIAPVITISTTAKRKAGSAWAAIHLSKYDRLIVHCGATRSTLAVLMLATSKRVESSGGHGNWNARNMLSNWYRSIPENTATQGRMSLPYPQRQHSHSAYLL